MFPKIVVPPNHPLKNRVFHYFHHPFWDVSPYFLETPICKNGLGIEFRCSKMRMKFYEILAAWQAATHQAPSIQLHIAIEPAAIVSSPSHSLLSTQDGLIVCGWMEKPMKMPRFMMLNDTLEDTSER